MRTKTRTTLATTSVAVLGLVVWGGPPDAPVSRAQPPERHKEGGQHGGDMFRTSRRSKTIAISDARLAVDRVRYTPLAGHRSPVEGEQGQTLVLFEGDIILGTEQELEQAATDRVVHQAQAINPDDPALAALTATQKDTIRRLKAIEPQSKQASAAAKKAEASKVLSQAALLGTAALEDKTHLKEIGGATSKYREEIRSATGKYRGRLKDVVRPNTPGAPTADDDPIDLVGGQGTAPMVFGEGASGRLWPQGVIPFEFDPTFPAAQRPSVQQAIDHWHSKTTHVRFVARNQLQAPGQFHNRIVFIPAAGCASRVGMKLTPGAQGVQLAPGCFAPQVIHELGHAVGLWHEQSRNDRDSFLRIQPQNIDPTTLFNFDKVGAAGMDLGPFDFDSIMLYPPKSFSSNGQPSMVRLAPGSPDFGIDTGSVGGTTRELSPLDIFGVETLYPSPAAANP